jgi:class 3 adenylate cyclase
VERGGTAPLLLGSLPQKVALRCTFSGGTWIHVDALLTVPDREPARSKILQGLRPSSATSRCCSATSSASPRSPSRSDPEEVRELLSGYFELARAIVARYGGVVEKFIGDAVMAVWGVPAAQEDDAERAVRAGLELVAGRRLLRVRARQVELAARVGIVTGTAATTETPEEGLRRRRPGQHRGADPSRRAHRDAATSTSRRGGPPTPPSPTRCRSHELKGKAEPVQLYRRCASSPASAARSSPRAWKPPSSGATASFASSRTSSTPRRGEAGPSRLGDGIAGIGKSRLAWEFYKYMDGLSDLFRWHRGRCLSYGEGVAYWALAEMVRGRAGILEAEDAASAAVEAARGGRGAHRRPEERRWVEPRLAHLHRARGAKRRDKEDLFAAWRLFFERMSEVQPVVMSFEDMQWADASLLDFIEYLLDWSRTTPSSSSPSPARDRRTPAELGCRPAELHLDLPGAALAGRP